ncbi:MAG: SDR family NAD(P)-dependent oxidoreductase [Burkholderiales bacterium]|nr:SDR family NAD(P)-dependent oxidoreductase [Burkholderiales bacterium]
MRTLEQSFPKKRVLITGASSGLGKALALEFAGRGWKVAVTDLDAARIKETADAVRAAGGEPLEMVLDVTRCEQFEAAAHRVTEAWQGLDVLVNNAGVADAGRMEDGLTLENWRLLVDVNLWSVIYGCRTFIPVLKKGGKGHIFNVASGAGLLCLPEMASYNATKAAVVAISATLKTELIVDNIDVTVCCASAFRSNIADNERIRQCSSVAGRGIMAKIKQTSITAESVARYSIRSMEKGRLFSLPQADAGVMWALSRWMPEKYRRLLTYLFNKRKWLFAPGT